MKNIPALMYLCLFTVTIGCAGQVIAEVDGAARSEFLSFARGNTFYVKATGDVEYEGAYSIESRAKNQEIFWECSPSALRLGFAKGQLMRPESETLVLVVDEQVSPGQMGAFSMRGIQWTNGQIPMEGQPEDSAVKVPRNFSGEGGELKLTNHVGTSRSERRFQGVADGQVQSSSGDLTVQLHVEFDLTKACGF